jgi:MraZ protein
MHMPNSTETELWGEFDQNVDDKGRLVLPMDLRAPLNDEFVITKSLDQALWLLPMAQWNEIYEEIKPGAPRTARREFLLRQHGGRSFAKADAQSRITLPKHFRDYAGVNNDNRMVLVGQGDRVELWGKAVWDKYNKRVLRSEINRISEQIDSESSEELGSDS